MGRCLAYRNGVANGTAHSGSNQSDSEVEEAADTVHSPVSIPLASSTSSPPYSPRSLSKSSSNQIFFPSSENTPNSSEPNTSKDYYSFGYLCRGDSFPSPLIPSGTDNVIFLFFRWTTIMGFFTAAVERLDAKVYELHYVEESRLGRV